jgi:hypothetical protein
MAIDVPRQRGDGGAANAKPSAGMAEEIIYWPGLLDAITVTGMSR